MRPMDRRRSNANTYFINLSTVKSFNATDLKQLSLHHYKAVLNTSRRFVCVQIGSTAGWQSIKLTCESIPLRVARDAPLALLWLGHSVYLSN